MLTVKRFLSLPIFHELNLVAGFDHLDNQISSVNIMDNPDGLDWLSTGELLVTSGYFLHESPESQLPFLAKLKEINCPALCLKPKRYLTKTPQKMIDYANQIGLPLIEIPYGLPFSKIMKTVHDENNERVNHLTQRAVEVHQLFFELSLNGSNHQKIAQELAELLQNAILLVDHNWQLIDWAERPANPLPLKDCLILEKKHTIFLEQIFTDNENKEDIHALQKSIIRTIETPLGPISLVIRPVHFNNIHYGYILVWQSEQLLKEIDFITLENGSMAFALERIQNTEIEQAKNNIKNDFFEELLAHSITNRDTLDLLARQRGINPDLAYTILITQLTFPKNSQAQIIETKQFEERAMKTIVESAINYLDKTTTNTHVFRRNQRLITLIGSPGHEHGKAKTYLNRIGLGLIQALNTTLTDNLQITCAFGTTINHLFTIDQSFSEANETLALSATKESSTQLYHYDDFFLEHFLKETISRNKMLDLINATLGPIISYDQKNQTELFATLDVLTAHQLNIAVTARKLFIHRNTLLYRIEKIEELLAVNLKDANALFQINLAIRCQALCK